MEHAEIPAEAVDESSIEQLAVDVERYLETVTLFRDLGCEPTWRSELQVESRVLTLIAPFIDRVSPV